MTTDSQAVDGTPASDASDPLADGKGSEFIASRFAITADPSAPSRDAADRTDSSKDREEAEFPPAPSEDDVRARINSRRKESASQAEMENIRRNLGHVNRLQSDVAQMRETLGEVSSVTQTVKQMQDRIDALTRVIEGVLPPEDAASIRESVNGSAIEARLTDFERRIMERLDAGDDLDDSDESPSLDPEQAAMMAQWQSANEAVWNRAQELGVSETLTEQDFQRAQYEGRGDPVAAVTSLFKVLEERATASKRGAASSRRSQRAEEGKAPVPAEREASLAQYDLSSRSGIAAARRDGVISSEDFIKAWRAIDRGQTVRL